MKARIVFIMMLTLSSCSLLKNTNKTVDAEKILYSQQTAFNLKDQKDYLKKTGSILLSQDSANHTYSIELWPKGVFTYSAQQGFVGEASKVLISGNKTENKQTNRSMQSLEKDHGQLTLSANERLKLNVNEKHSNTKSQVSWKLLLVGLLIVIIIIWYLLKKIKQFKILKI